MKGFVYDFYLFVFENVGLLNFGCPQVFGGPGGFRILVVLRFLEALEGLERSGRLVGKISSRFRRNPISWYRLMTRNRVNRELIGLIGLKKRL